jgi:peptidylprolyl isomerase
MFHTHVFRDRPQRSEIKALIPGMAEALTLMVAGEERRLWIPAALAWGNENLALRMEEQPGGPVIIDIKLLRVLR